MMPHSSLDSASWSGISIVGWLASYVCGGVTVPTINRYILQSRSAAAPTPQAAPAVDPVAYRCMYALQVQGLAVPSKLILPATDLVHPPICCCEAKITVKYIGAKIIICTLPVES